MVGGDAPDALSPVLGFAPDGASTPAALPVDTTPSPPLPVRAGGHGHLWRSPEGTGLHAPPGQLIVDPATGRVHCHLCGRPYALLGAHVRVHGVDAAEYRQLAGLCTTRALAAPELRDRLAERAAQRYEDAEQVRDRLEPGRQLARTGQLAQTARRARRAEPAEPLERRTARAAHLSAGRRTQERRSAQRLAVRLAALGADDLSGHLRIAYAAGASLETLQRDTGLGRQRLRRALVEAGVTIRPTGVNTVAGKRSRADAADAAAAERLGVPDVTTWLHARHDEGWSMQQLAAAVGHTSHWVRWRLERSA